MSQVEGEVSQAQEQDLLDVARDAARAAAAELLPRFGQVARDVHAKSTPTDLASEADLEAEAAVRRLLGSRRPQDAILGRRRARPATATCAGWSTRSTER